MAEGVETSEQKHFLQSLGITRLQGYFFSKPLPENAFLDLLDANEGKVTAMTRRTSDHGVLVLPQ